MQSMPDLENDLLVLLSDVARHLRRHVDQLAQHHGMTLAQLMILARLGTSPASPRGNSLPSPGSRR